MNSYGVSLRRVLGVTVGQLQVFVAPFDPDLGKVDV